MKKLLLAFAMVGSFMFLASCKDKPAETPPAPTEEVAPDALEPAQATDTTVTDDTTVSESPAK